MGMGMYVGLPDGERAMDKEPLPRMLQVLGMNTQTLFLLHSPPPHSSYNSLFATLPSL